MFKRESTDWGGNKIEQEPRNYFNCYVFEAVKRPNEYIFSKMRVADAETSKQIVRDQIQLLMNKRMSKGIVFIGEVDEIQDYENNESYKHRIYWHCDSQNLSGYNLDNPFSENE